MTLDTLINKHFKSLYKIEEDILSYKDGLITPKVDTLNPELIYIWLDYINFHNLLSFSKQKTFALCEMEMPVLPDQGSGAMIEIDNGRTGIRVFDEDQFIACLTINQKHNNYNLN